MMILVKQQTNGNDRTVLKRDASVEDVQSEVKRLQEQLGYEVTSGQQRGTWLLSHKSYRGEFLLTLESDEGSAV